MSVQLDPKIASTIPASMESGPRSRPASVKQAAMQFEALLIGEILKSARTDSGGGWLGSGGDQAGESMSELAEQQVAQVLSASGAFGMTKLIEQGLEHSAHPASRAGSHL